MRPKAELVRFVLTGDGLARDPEAKLPGRGAYLCPSAECAERARGRNAFNRSFRAPVSFADNVLDFTS